MGKTNIDFVHYSSIFLAYQNNQKEENYSYKTKSKYPPTCIECVGFWLHSLFSNIFD